MSANAPHAANAGGGRIAADPPAHALTLGESAWLALLPCTLALLAAMLLLGPPLGALLLAPPATSELWPHLLAERAAQPEPTEHARYLIALLGPLLASGGMLVLAGRRMRTTVATALVPLSQAALVVAVLASIAVQARYVQPEGSITAYFTSTTYVAAFAVAASMALVLSSPRRALLARRLRETPRRRAVAIATAALFVGVWLLSGYNTDATIDRAHPAVEQHTPFWIAESFAILGGHAPLVDFHPQYGQLWAYVGALGMSLLGASLGVYAGIMLAATAAALAAVLATFRRVTGSSLAALTLFMPFVATGFFMKLGPIENRYGPANLYSLFPIRYAGPFLLLWLVARRAQHRPVRGSPLALLTVAGVVTINNLEFGLPAFGATVAALLWLEPRPTAATVARLAAHALGGLALAAALVSLLTVLVSGSLPSFGLLAEYPRLYGREGFGMLPMQPFGFHLAVYATLAATIVVATLRAASGRRDALTGTLVWAGVFGLGAGAYFVGRSHPQVLVDLFAAWALALSLLLVAVVRGWRPGRRPGGPALLVLASFGLCVCSLAQTPTPWSQLERLGQTTPTTARTSTLERRFVDRVTTRGESVALLVTEGHRIAHELGLVNVSPYTNVQLMLTRRQWEKTLGALERAGGTRLIVPVDPLRDEQLSLIADAGYVPEVQDETRGAIAFVAAEPAG